MLAFMTPFVYSLGLFYICADHHFDSEISAYFSCWRKSLTFLKNKTIVQ